MSDYVMATIHYALGVFMGWWVWGRKLRDLRRVAEDTVRVVQRHIEAGEVDGA